jgi:hypothetical protein
LSNSDACLKKYSLPNEYNGLDEMEVEVKCPVCHQDFVVLWEMEADYDVEKTDTGYAGWICGGFPDPKCLFCNNCHFYVDGRDMDTYLPPGFEIEIEYEPDFDDYYG